MKLSVIGLGKLGICTAVCFSSKGYEVIGVDINEHFVRSVNEGKAPLHEPRLQDLIDQSKGTLRATTDFEEALLQSDITFLIVPTPSLPDGSFSNEYLKNALKPLAAALKKKNDYHVFVVTSTVSPGATETILIPFIEEHSEKKLHRDFGVAYNPEFIALGSVITDFLNPDMVLIGESEARVGETLQRIYENVSETTPYIARMSLVSAEIAKISLNSYVTMKISFANTLGNLCSEIEGANVDDITKALGADERISPYYLKGGLGFGGPCFPRDNRAFAAFAAGFGVDAHLAKATDRVNQDQHKRLFHVVQALCREQKTRAISVLGLSYKANTPVIEESASVKLIEQLISAGYVVTVHDALAMDNAKQLFGDRIHYAESIEACFSASSVCVVGTADPLWKTISHAAIVHHPTVVLDCWRIFENDFFPSSVRLIQLGHTVSSECSEEVEPHSFFEEVASVLC